MGKEFDHSKYENWIDPKICRPYERNAKIHTKKQIDNICNSIKRFGWQQDTVITSDNVLVIGHGRREAAIRLKCEMPFHRIDKTSDALTDKDIRELRIADNQTNSETGYDEDLLSVELEDLDMVGFDFDFGEIGLTEHDDVTEDEYTEPGQAEESKAKPGDIYRLGKHRLMCGDSTDSEQVSSLMDGELADMVFTDPPYGVSYTDKNEFLNSIDKSIRIVKAIENDSQTPEEMHDFWVSAFKNLYNFSKKKMSYYITAPQGGDLLLLLLLQAVRESGFALKHQLIWNKNNHVLGRCDYNYKHEPIVYGWKLNGTHEFVGGGEMKTSVWDVDKPLRSDLHPTMKPVKLIANAIENSTKPGDIVLDLFGGSGSTLIACEQTGRTCYMMELDSHYIDVIINRWEQLTGEQAELLNG